MKSFLFILTVLLLSGNLLVAQPLSQKKISLSLQNNSALEALVLINSLEGVKLSYSPDRISNEKMLTKAYVEQPTDYVLKDILGNKFELKYRGSYVIIQSLTPKETQNKTIKFSGQVKDAQTGEHIKDATIYEVNKLSSTLTDDKGNFELSIAAKTEKVTFSISREHYQDTLIQVSNISQLSQSLVLRPDTGEEKISNRFEIETKKLVLFFTSKISRQNVKNVKLEEERFFQLSLVPMLGTNGKLSGKVTNKLSINLLAGYSNAVNGFELGGFYNINRSQMKGLQIGGFGNATGGRTNGVQIGGFINTTKGYTSGVQTAGFFNLVSNDVNGLQLAGFLNIAAQTTGVQIGGFTNVATGQIRGLQLAGITNTSKDLSGVQVSGFVNVAKNVNGFQLAGFANYAKKVKGVQLSVINIADTVESGVTIGLINFIKKGKHQFGLEYNDFMDVNASYRSGTDRFYSILSASIGSKTTNLWAVGFGFGTQYNIKNKFYGNVELSSHYVPFDRQSFEAVNYVNRLNINFGYRFAKHFSLNMGPVFNLYVTDVYDSNTGAYGSDFGQSPFYSNTSNGTNISMWVGYAAALRF